MIWCITHPLPLPPQIRCGDAELEAVLAPSAPFIRRRGQGGGGGGGGGGGEGTGGDAPQPRLKVDRLKPVAGERPKAVAKMKKFPRPLQYYKKTW